MLFACFTWILTMNDKILTVSVFIMHACDLSVWQDLNVKADAHITVKPSESLYPQQVFSISSCHLSLVPGAAASPNQ